jgi:hypothetical protein
MLESTLAGNARKNATHQAWASNGVLAKQTIFDLWNAFFFHVFKSMEFRYTPIYIYTCIHNIHQNGMIGKQDMKIRGSGLSPFRKKLRNNLNSSVHGNLRGMPAKGT